MLMTADFRYLIFMNYHVDREVLESRLPDGVYLQLLNGKPYVSVVAFLFENLEVLGIPAPFHQQFEEVNLRFYVYQKDSVKGEKQGVVFIREIVPKSLVTAAARVLFNEKYLTLPMQHHYELGPQKVNTIEYSWQTSQKSFVRVAFKNEWQYPAVNSPEYFFITRPYGYTRLADGKTNEITMEHPIWRTCRVLDAVTEYEDLPTVFGPEFVPYLTLKPASVFLAEGSRISIKS